MAIDPQTATVQRFYEATPFPGYPPRDNLAALRRRAERSAFASLLDRSIASDARIVEIGCGTGQMSLYLARERRVIVAIDLSRNALRLGEAAARRFAIPSVTFIQADLHNTPLRARSFDVVYSAGVLHHTPFPPKAFACLAGLARPGGIVIVGVYNAFARIPLRVRRAVARVTRFRIVPFDAVWRERRGDAARGQSWLRDQYQHPTEHRHTLAEVKRWFADNDIEYLRSFPGTVFGDETDDLFTPAIDDWAFESWIAQVEWMWTLGHEGGLFFTIGRRR